MVVWVGKKVPVRVWGTGGEDVSHRDHCVGMIWLLNKHLKGLLHIHTLRFL